MQPGKPLISIVIPTMGRPILRKTLDSVLATEGSEVLEVMVIGPVTQEPTSSYLCELVAKDSRVRHLPISFPKGDASEKRNHGFRDSKADLVAFLDDDVFVPAHWTKRILSAFSEPDVGMVSGPSLVPTDIPLLARLAGLALSSPAAGAVAYRYIKNPKPVQRVKWSRIIGCNMIFRRSAFQQIRGFDPEFYPGEEMVAADAVAKNSHALVFDSEAYVYHYPKQTFRGFWRQIYRYGATRLRLIKAGLDIEWAPLVPGVWVLSLVVLGIGAIWCRWCLWLLLLDIALYSIVSLLVTLRVAFGTRRAGDLLLFFIQPFMHIAYGVGIWSEVLRPDKDLSDKIGRPTD